jgi:hypothetical protein
VPNITQEQLDLLQDKVRVLVGDKTAADGKTQVSHAADTKLTQAQAEASQAKLEEAAADATVSADLADLTGFIDGLRAPPPTPGL